MVKRSKNFSKAKEMVEKDEYTLEEAVGLVKKMSFVKFDESLDISLNLGVDPKHSDQAAAYHCIFAEMGYKVALAEKQNRSSASDGFAAYICQI